MTAQGLQHLVGNTWKIYPSPAARLLLLEEVHLAYLHIGAPKLFQLLHSTYWWPDMERECKLFCRSCFTCQLEQATHSHTWSGRMIPPPPGPRLEWSIDLLTDLPATPNAPKHILTMVDTFSKFVLIAALPDRSAATISQVVRERLIGPFGVPLSFRVDNGTEFAGAFSALCSCFATRRIHTSPFHSPANGQVERFQRTIATYLRRALHGLPLPAWPHFLPELQLTLNCTYHRALGCAPYLIMFGSPPIPLLPCLDDPAITPA